MKLLVTFLFTFSTVVCGAQKIEKFFDHNWKPTTNLQVARYYSIMEKKDSVWQAYDYFIFEKTLQMKGTFKDSAQKIRHGEFTWFYANGFMSMQGNYVNNKAVGTWISYHANGSMSDSSTYVYGNKRGVSLSWHYNGFLSDSTVNNADGSGVVVQWFDNGNPATAGKLAAGGQPVTFVQTE